MFINRFGTFVVPFLTLYLGEQGFRAGQIAWVFTAWAVGGIGSMILGGRLSDLIGRKYTMTLALVGGGFSMLLMWQAQSLNEYIFTAFLAGLTHGMYHPASNSLLADVVPTERRVTAFAVVRLGVNLGFFCGMAAGGFLAEKNYAWLFIGDAATSITFGLIALFALPHGIRTAVKQSRWGPALRHMLSNRLFLGFFFANLLIVGTFFQWGTSVARLVVDLGHSKHVYGLLMSMNGLIIAFFEIPISQVARRFPAYRVLALGFFLCGLGMWVNLFAFSWVIVAVSLLVFTIGEMTSLPVSGAYLADMAPEDMRGRYAAAHGLTWNLGHAVASGVGSCCSTRNSRLCFGGECWPAEILAAAVMLWARRGAASEQ